jgi:hypothetical protein
VIDVREVERLAAEVDVRTVEETAIGAGGVQQ